MSPEFLLEALNGVYFSLFNGCFEIKVMALRVIDAIHQRAVYELFADVTLVSDFKCRIISESVFRNSF